MSAIPDSDNPTVRAIRQAMWRPAEAPTEQVLRDMVIPWLKFWEAAPRQVKVAARILLRHSREGLERRERLRSMMLDYPA